MGVQRRTSRSRSAPRTSRLWSGGPVRWLLVVTFVTGALAGAGAQALFAATASGEPAAPAASAQAPGEERSGPAAPSTSTTTMPTTTSTVAPGPGRVFVSGDSVTVQAMVNGLGPDAPADVEVSAWLGWTAEHAQPPLDAAAATRPVDVLVVALGLNDSALRPGSDGWNDDDRERLRQMIFTPDIGACVVLVLPGHGPGIDAQYAAELGEARMALLELAMERQRVPDAGATVVVDWQAEVDANPALLDPDGIHLPDDPATGEVAADAASARNGLYWQGVQQCQGG
jgi:hypothetical protein